MTQHDLFSYRDNETPESRFNIHPRKDFPRARNTDPITSFEAADNVKNFADNHYAKILQALSKSDLGKDAIAWATGLDKSQVSRRLSELQKQGKIELTGKKVKSDAGLPEREWRRV